MSQTFPLSRYLSLVIFGFAFLLIGCVEETPQTYTIGVINLAPQLEPVLDGFKTGMTELGYQEAQLTYIYAGPAPNIDALDDQMQALLDADIDLILAISTPATQAAYHATLNTDIPVVFGPVTDPIDAGVVMDLSQPGGNVTGVALGTLSEGQRLQWLLRMVSDVQRIYVPYNADDASANASVMAAIAAAGEAGVELMLREVRTADEITSAIDEIPDNVQAIFLAQDSLVAARIDDFAAAAITHQLPLCTPTDGQVERGALVSYSFRLEALGKQIARLGDQILSGTAPADLPVETAEFFLTINMNTAAAINLEISEEVLRAADKLIR